MDTKKNNRVTPLEDGDGTASACEKALVETCKALKAFSFYPENHPLREQLLHLAFQAMADLSRPGRVSLIVQRSGLSFADRQGAFENSPMTRALAQELFSRELQRLTFLPELSLTEFSQFLSLLTIAPQKISDAGGVAGMLAKSGIGTIIANEIDITAVYTRKKAGEAADDATAKAAGGREDRDEIGSSAGSLSDQSKELTIEELLASMSAETDHARYHRSARLLLAKGQTLKLEGNFDRLFTILKAMVEQGGDAAKSAACRECALMVLQQLSPGEMTEHLLTHLEDENVGQKETIYLMLHRLGFEAARAIISRLVAAGGKFAGSSLATALVRIGQPAQPPLTALLNDGRWQVVHSAAAILGEMGSRDAVRGLARAISHSDSRVRMEAIRSLARIGGMEATAVLTGLLRDDDKALAMQAITWLGNTRNKAALQALLQLVMKADLLGKSQPLKKEALAAIGRIGDRRALDPLIRLVSKRYWIVPSRWDELKLLAVEAIGHLGGEQARVFLETASAGTGHLCRASYAALETMAQVRGDNHG